LVGGIRLKGKDSKLKRSSAIEEAPPTYAPVLETLNIFGIDANYLEQFREYLIEEGIEVDSYLDIPIAIRINDEYLKEGLLIPHVDKRLFKKEELFALAIDENIYADVDLIPKVDIEDSRKKDTVSMPNQNSRFVTSTLHILMPLTGTVFISHFLRLKFKRTGIILSLPNKTSKKLSENNSIVLNARNISLSPRILTNFVLLKMSLLPSSKILAEVLR